MFWLYMNKKDGVNRDVISREARRVMDAPIELPKGTNREECLYKYSKKSQDHALLQKLIRQQKWDDKYRIDNEIN
jgi:hypothetical protein